MATHDWKEYSGVVAVPNGTTGVAIALQIYGPGKVWFDKVEARYEKEASRQAIGRRIAIRVEEETPQKRYRP